jgi:hypothetical protein
MKRQPLLAINYTALASTSMARGPRKLMRGTSKPNTKAHYGDQCRFVAVCNMRQSHIYHREICEEPPNGLCQPHNGGASQTPHSREGIQSVAREAGEQEMAAELWQEEACAAEP